MPQQQWQDIAAQLDPNMPQEQYNSMRQKYFNDVIKPKVRQGYSVESTYNQFLKQTERPSAMSDTDKLVVKAGMFANAATKAMLPGVGDKITAKADATLKPIAEREGIKAPILEGAGNLLGQAIGIAPLLSGAGGIAEELAGTFLKGEKAVALGAKVAKGGIAFATYDALAAKDGDRVGAALRGGAIGAAFEGVLGAVFPEGGKVEVKPATDPIHQATSAAINGTAPELEKSVAEHLADTVEKARKQGYLTGPMTENPSKKGIQLTVKLTSESGATHDFPIKRGEEPEMTAFIQKTLDNGGSFDGIDYHPNARTRAAKIARQFQDQAQAADATVRVKTETGFKEVPVTPGPKGAAPDRRIQLGRGMNPDGQVTVEFEDPAHKDLFAYASKLKASSTGQNPKPFPEAQAELARLSYQLGIPESDVVKTAYTYRQSVIDATKTLGPGATFKAPPPSGFSSIYQKFDNVRGPVETFADPLDEKAHRLGSIRYQIREQGGIPGPMHREMHSFAGDIAQEFGLTRQEAGDQGLQYFGRVQGSTGEIPSFREQVEGFKGSGTQGVRPAAGWDPASSAFPERPRGRGYLKPTPNESMLPTIIGQDVRVRPTGTTVVIPTLPGFEGGGGAVVKNEGMDPVRIITDNSSRGDLFHESIHQGQLASGLEDAIHDAVGGHKETALDLAKGIMQKFRTTYRGFSGTMMFNEAFAHAAEAVRMGNEGAIEELGRMDSGAENVKEFVHATSKGLLEGTYALDTAPVRAFQRRLGDLIRRTDPERSLALRRAQATGYRTWFDPEVGQWIMKDGEGRELMKPHIDDVWAEIEKSDPSDHFPDVAHSSYFKGIQGPAGPFGTEPIDGPSTPELDVPMGSLPVTGWFQPFLDNAASVAGKFKKFGQEEFGQKLYDAAADSADAVRTGDKWQEGLLKDYSDVMKSVPRGKLLDYGEALSRDEQHWGAMGDAVNLDGTDLARLRTLAELDKKMTDAGGVGFREALTQIKNARNVNGEFSRLQGNSPALKAMRSGSLGWDDLNVTKTFNWAARESVSKLYTEGPLGRLESLIKDKPGMPDSMSGPFKNYVRYVRGGRDVSQKMLEDFTGNVQSAFSNKAKQLNKTLPAGMKLPENMGTPKGFINGYMTLISVSNLGGRPAMFVRDVAAGLMQIAALGPSAFSEGLGRMLTSEGREEAKAVMSSGRDIRSFFGDITSEIPSSRAGSMAAQFADTVMMPSQYGHGIPKGIAYLGEKAKAFRAITKYRAGQINALELADSTTAWFQDEAPRSRLLAMAGDESKSVAEVSDTFARAFNDVSQFGMGRGKQPAILRTGAGRLLGQYATWPLSYIQFVRKLSQRAMDNPKKGIPALATWLAMNYAVFSAAQSLSIDASKWLLFSPAGFAGSPTMEMIGDILAAPEETQKGLDARKRLHDAPMNFVPTGIELDAIYKSMESGDTSLPSLLGFRPAKSSTADWDEWLRTEAGFSKNPKP